MNSQTSSKPASLAEISDALQVLFDALPFQRGAKTDNVAAAYLESLRGLSAEAINAGVRKFLRGECEGVSPRFVPTPPELAQIVRKTVVPSRVPEERRIAPFRPAVAGERERLRLKMPMWQAAFPSPERLDGLAKANAEGFGAMVVLASQWGVPVPQELLDMPEAEAERQWRHARNQAWAEIERNPPPFMQRGNRVFQSAA